MRCVVLAVTALFLLAHPARADVTSARPGGFLISAQADTTSSPDEAWDALVHVQRWWSSSHTYSGDARRLSLDPRAGGCWCERWGSGQTVEHARIVLVMERDGVRTLRAVGGLGPLQEMGAAGVMTFTITPRPAGASIAMTYRVSGDPDLGFEAMAPLVDGVLMEQFSRLIRYSSTGTPG